MPEEKQSFGGEKDDALTLRSCIVFVRPGTPFSGCNVRSPHVTSRPLLLLSSKK